MNRKLRRRLRVIAARATLCAAMMAALGFTGYHQVAPDGDLQVAGLSP